MITLFELVLVALLIALPLRGLVRWSRKRRAISMRWQPRIRSIGAGTVVELVREGQPTMRIATLDPVADDFSTKLEEARAAAIERATALNSAGRGLTA